MRVLGVGGVWRRVLGVGFRRVRLGAVVVVVVVWGRVLGVGVRGVRLGAVVVMVVAWCVVACPRSRVRGVRLGAGMVVAVIVVSVEGK